MSEIKILNNKYKEVIRTAFGCALSSVLHMILSDTREGKIDLQRKKCIKTSLEGGINFSATPSILF